MEKRLDAFLVEKGYVPSREKAKELIRKGQVYVDGRPVDKPSRKYALDADLSIEIKGDLLSFVSRGGLKLAKAVEAFGLDLTGCVCIDAGASTGGFTDCMLQNGADKVYAVDVGYGQLAWKLREDPRVVVLEKTNVRFLNEEIIPELCDFASADLSFISLNKVLPAIWSRMKPEGRMVCLVKPQFEAGREKVGKKGVVRDPEVHREVLRAITAWAGANELTVRGLTYSPVRGPEGNIEYLLYMDKSGQGLADSLEDLIGKVVQESHETL